MSYAQPSMQGAMVGCQRVSDMSFGLEHTVGIGIEDGNVVDADGGTLRGKGGFVRTIQEGKVFRHHPIELTLWLGIEISHQNEGFLPSTSLYDNERYGFKQIAFGK